MHCSTYIDDVIGSVLETQQQYDIKLWRDTRWNKVRFLHWMMLLLFYVGNINVSLCTHRNNSNRNIHFQLDAQQQEKYGNSIKNMSIVKWFLWVRIRMQMNEQQHAALNFPCRFSMSIFYKREKRRNMRFQTCTKEISYHLIGKDF